MLFEGAAIVHYLIESQTGSSHSRNENWNVDDHDEEGFRPLISWDDLIAQGDLFFLYAAAVGELYPNDDQETHD